LKLPGHFLGSPGELDIDPGDLCVLRQGNKINGAGVRLRQYIVSRGNVKTAPVVIG
jgi:hypothetical protein